MSLKEVFITRTSSYLPNDPVANDQMESFLGLINEQASKMKGIVLRNNGIKNRYYAMDKEGKLTHTNAELAAVSIKKLFEKNPSEIEEIQLLSCGTSSPDQLMPSHGNEVHGKLPESKNIEVISPAGNCCSGMHALKFNYLSIKSGETTKSVSSASERLSRVMHSDTFNLEVDRKVEMEENPFIAFEKDFLRWMLSDGSAAFLLENKKNENGISLRIDWIESMSFANQIEACMYMACEKLENGDLKSYKDYTGSEILDYSILSVKQDVKLLSKHIVSLGFKGLKSIFESRGLTADDVTYFLPHMSSYFFEDKIYNELRENGMEIPKERWYSNLRDTGNVGAASIYMMVDDLWASGNLKVGETILLAVPESARFSYVFAFLTVC
ncbi:MAG: beta-ketoacyl-ACP synthase III [Crocinitomicaceae bacterium]